MVAVLMVGTGHGASDRETSVKRPAPVWPAPPDTPLFRYEYTLQSPADAGVEDKRSWIQRLVTDERDWTKEVILDKPVAIAARRGRILIADSAKKMIIVFDIPRRRVYRFGVRDDPGRLDKPVSVALDTHMRAYVVDATAKRVHVYDDMGLYLHSIGSSATLSRPTGVAVDSKGESIYVVDRSGDDDSNPRVVRFDAKGNVTQIIGTPGESPGQLNIPLKAVVDADGFLYVLDSGNFRVQVFDPQGRFVRMFGAPGSAAGALSRPRGMAVGEYVYVADTAFGNVQIFNKQGDVLLAVGALAKNPGDHSAGEYSLISDVAVDETGRIYILDQYFRKVEIIKPIGKPTDSTLSSIPDVQHTHGH